LADESQPDPWNTGFIVAERYQILERLGAGGMGVVYRCRDLKSGRLRAIKTIRRDLEPDSRELVRRFIKAEADALARVESDFVVRIFDAQVLGEADDETPFVVMELLTGQDVEHVLKERGRLPPQEVVTLLWQAACALKAIHAEGIVHRDLKPANLFIKTRDDGSLELKVLDFSISRLLDRANGRTTMIVGTRGYMAPEQAAGYDVDHRADIYALGQVAHAMLQAPGEPFRVWHTKATAADRRDRFTSATQAIEALSTALGTKLPIAPLTANSQSLLATASTVFAPSKRDRTRLLALGAGVLIVAIASLLISPSRTPQAAALVAASATSRPAPIGSPLPSAPQGTIMQTALRVTVPTASVSSAPNRNRAVQPRAASAHLQAPSVLPPIVAPHRTQERPSDRF
jgi:serine/threonine protein kinase